MEYNVKSGTPQKQRSGCLIVGVYTGRKLSAAAREIDEVSQGALSQILRRGDHSGKTGLPLLLHRLPNLPSERVLLIGCGKDKEFNEARYREVTAAAVSALKNTGSTEAMSFLTELDVKGRDIVWKLRQAVEIIEGALYRFDQTKGKKNEGEEKRALKRLTLAVPKRSDLPPGEAALTEALAISAGLKLTKDLGNLPPNICTPTYIAEQAVALAKEYGMKATVLEEADMKELGMGSLLSVARGSQQPPKLIAVEYKGADGAAPIALVGKGITFDTGGISIKPAANMDEMKYDMCGAASVIGTLKAVAELKLRINLVGIIPTCENMPSGNASRPGDVVASMSGQTIEILNTDAEGRLILCDALTYAAKFQPAAVIDIATLTGAIVIALGNTVSGLFANNDQLARDLLNAGKYTYDRAWQMPLYDEYQKQLDTNFADMANVGGREGGAITAACFLSRYTRDYKWAHIDIAGTAWKTGKEKGATGRPVPLLTQFLINRAAAGAPTTDE